jgi:hypothetical protein
MSDQWILDRLTALEAKVASLEAELRGKATGRVRAAQIKDWTPKATELAWAKEKFPEVDEPKEREKFVDYWRSRGEARKDWDAAYRNWIRKAAEYGNRPRANGPASRTATIDALNRERRERVSAQLSALWGDNDVEQGGGRQGS